jgi:hypothetical protein
LRPTEHERDGMMVHVNERSGLLAQAEEHRISQLDVLGQAMRRVEKREHSQEVSLEAAERTQMCRLSGVNVVAAEL